MYRPLPNYLTIKESRIEGLGLFTTEYIEQGMEIGVSHYLIDDELIRTPLGGFYNHSLTPNCFTKVDKKRVVLTTCRDIEEGEELTVFYTMAPLEEID